MQLYIYCIAQVHLVACTQQVASLISRDRIPTLQHAQRTALLQLQQQPIQSLTFHKQKPLPALAQFRLTPLQQQTKHRHLATKIK